MIFDLCYKEAGVDKEFAAGCDRISEDAMDFVWEGLAFYDQINNDKDNYMVIFGNIPYDILQAILKNL